MLVFFHSGQLGKECMDTYEDKMPEGFMIWSQPIIESDGDFQQVTLNYQFGGFYAQLFIV